jgi:phosphoribosylglycinamide formyltransferase-1
MAADLGLPTQVVSHQNYAAQADPRAAFDQALMQAINAHQPALVLLAGFMRILTPAFVQAHAGRLINVHPSLLPAFTGLHTHDRAIAAGCKFAGATVHRVTEVLDEGAILEQSVVPVLPEDDAQSLAARVLATEHLIYPRAVRRLLAAGIS